MRRKSIQAIGTISMLTMMVLVGCDMTDHHTRSGVVKTALANSNGCSADLMKLPPGSRGLFQFAVFNNRLRGKKLQLTAKGYVAALNDKGKNPLESVNPYAILGDVPLSFREKKALSKVAKSDSLADLGDSIEGSLVPFPTSTGASIEEIADVTVLRKSYQQYRQSRLSLTKEGQPPPAPPQLLEFKMSKQRNTNIYATDEMVSEDVAPEEFTDEQIPLDDAGETRAEDKDSEPGKESSKLALAARMRGSRTIVARMEAATGAPASAIAIPGDLESPKLAGKPLSATEKKSLIIPIAPDTGSAPSDVSKPILSAQLFNSPSKTSQVICMTYDTGKDSFEVPMTGTDSAGKSFDVSAGGQYVVVSRTYTMKHTLKPNPETKDPGGFIYIQTSSNLVTSATIKEPPKPQ